MVDVPFRVLFVFSVFSTCNCQKTTRNITHNTTLGAIIGLEVLDGSKPEFYQFFKIPYALPPLGGLRFSKPLPHGKWNGTRDGTKFGPGCLQPKGYATSVDYTSEDCLFLNIYIPFHLSSSDRKPVMVWIHGGGYYVGAGSFYDGSAVAKTGDVIVVTINYRLNIFGFYTLGGSSAKGNYGLWDQIMAIEWVKHNIADYGGNPDQITIFGESAGGFSVGLLSLMPKNKGLFQRAIMQSGTSNTVLSIADPAFTSKLAGNKTGCPFNKENPEQTLKCMRNMSYTDIEAGTFTLEIQPESSPRLKIAFTPVVDEELLDREPAEILRDPSSPGYQFFKSLDIMVGNCDMEGYIYLFTSVEVQKKYGFNMTTGIPRTFFCNTLLPAIASEYFNDNQNVSSEICKVYGKGTTLAEQSMDVLHWYTDMVYLAPTTSTLLSHANNITATYQYVLTQSLPVYLGNYSGPPAWFQGSAHTTDLLYLFFVENFDGFHPHTTVKPTAADFLLSHTLRTYWTNFAKTGNPNSDGMPKWPIYKDADRAFISLNDAAVTAGVNYRKDKMELWLYEIPEKFQHKEIHTRLGPIKGRKAFVGQTKYLVYQFLNIPFAKPPVGDLRFKEPIEYGKWNGTLDATNYGPACFQDANYTITIWYGTSEDCLQLNIYVPFTTSPATPKSVMIWIHGGGYLFGTASFYDGSMIAAVGDVIVVTINYRLGIFGFLTLDEYGAKGNYGLLDQTQALKWVKENIADYGGNPNYVTIFGESAGGFSVGLLTLIPQNKGLFHRAIQESGTANSEITLGNPTKFSFETAKELGCSNKSTSLLQCMREKSASELLTKSTLAGTKLCNTGDLYCVQFGPVVDGEIIPRSPAQLLSDKTSAAFKFFQSLDIMIGNVVTEGSLFLSMLESDAEFQRHYNITAGIPRKYLCDTMSPNIAEHYFHNSTKVSTAICKEYGVHNNLSLQSREVLNVFGDLFFISPSVSSLNAHINPESSTYQFVYTQILSFVLGPKKPPWYIGPDHADELYYLFTMEYFDKILPNVTITQSDRLLAYQMRKYWTNFAKSGNPNSERLPVWSSYTHASPRYLQLSKNNMEIKTGYREKEMNFWLHNLPDFFHKTDSSKASESLSKGFVFTFTILFITCCKL